MHHRINIINSSQKSQDLFSALKYVLDTDINDAFINDIVSLPKDDVITIQICDYISDKALKTLNDLFRKRSYVAFRVYAGHYREEYNGWNLSFLSFIPSVSILIIDCKWGQESDFSVLSEMKNLKSLKLSLFDCKDYSFLKSLSIDLESLAIDAEMKSGKAKIDCRWLLRYHSLHTLYLGRVEKNLDSIVELSKLRNLTLRGGGAEDLSFLKKLQLEELEISWCNASKVDWNTLKDFSSLRSLILVSIKKLDDISFITTLANLEILKLIWMGAITKLPNFSNLTKLRVIDIHTCNKLIDVSGLVNVPLLEKVSIIGNSLTNEAAEILLNNPTIKDLSCYGNKVDFRVER